MSTTSALTDRYLARIRHEGPTDPSYGTAAALLRAHLRHIPFENFDSFSGRPVDPSPEAVRAKLVDRRRGGFCYEHATLFREALDALGFRTEHVASRVYAGGTPLGAPQTSHLSTLVLLDGERWLVDPGFGGQTPTVPLRLDEDAPQETPHGRHRFVAPEDIGLTPDELLGVKRMLQVENEDGSWQNQYGLHQIGVARTDIDGMCWFTSTHPRSHFTWQLSGARVVGESRINLADDRLTIRGPGGTERRFLDSYEGFESALREELALNTAEIPDLKAAWDRAHEAGARKRATAEASVEASAAGQE